MTNRLLLGFTWILASLMSVAAISCKLPETDDDSLGGSDLGGEIDAETEMMFDDEVERMLRMLFPTLSEKDLLEIKGSLDLKAVLALRDELEEIRKDVEKFSADLFKSASERVEERQKELADHNDGFPEGLEAIGRICRYDERGQHAEISLAGVFDGKNEVQLTQENVSVTVDGQEQDFTLQCLPDGTTVDIVFLIDITGSMSNVIHAVRDSVVDFVDLIESSGLRGTVGVVTFQDTVGVNRTFQQSAPARDYERSPFFAPVAIDDADAVDALRSFVNRLEANRGADAPENLAGAIDFARNNVIGYAGGSGEPNVIGDDRFDPAGTSPFPKLKSAQQVFVVLTDVGFHGDDRTESNSSLEGAFVPRNAADILATLHQTGTTVHVSDPSWVDTSLSPSKAYVDSDYWAVHTGGLGEDVVLGYSLVDLELVVVAEKSGLLDITLDRILETSCTLKLDALLSATAEVVLKLDVDGKVFETPLDVVRY